ncbi:MAG: sulfotransferase [Parvibaculaceae bacterium]
MLVHVGLPKTATSWLQEHLFSQDRHGFWAPAREEASGKQRVKAYARLFYLDGEGRLVAEPDFDADGLVARLSDVKVPREHAPVISNERLAGHVLSNAFDREMLARRIKAVLPEARIFVTFREQNAMILSSYMQYLKYGGWRSLDGFLSPPSDARMPTLDLQVWNYERLISLYHEIFGPEQTLALPYEMFARDPEEYIGRICRFAGVTMPSGLPLAKTENGRRSHFTSYHLRWLTCINRSTSANGFFPRPLGAMAGKMVDRGIKLGIERLVPPSWEACLNDRMAEKIETMVGDTFRASNQRTAELTGLDLAAYGYKT